MRRIGAAVALGTAALLLAATTSACSSTTDGQAVPAASGASATTGTASLPAADGTDVAACLDGQCEIAVSGPIDIPLDPKYRAEGLSVARVGSSNVTIKVQNGGGSSTFSVNRGGTTVYNGIRLRLVNISGGTAVLAIAPL